MTKICVLLFVLRVAWRQGGISIQILSTTFRELIQFIRMLLSLMS